MQGKCKIIIFVFLMMFVSCSLIKGYEDEKFNGYVTDGYNIYVRMKNGNKDINYYKLQNSNFIKIMSDARNEYRIYSGDNTQRSRIQEQYKKNDCFANHEFLEFVPIGNERFIVVMNDSPVYGKESLYFYDGMHLEKANLGDVVPYIHTLEGGIVFDSLSNNIYFTGEKKLKGYTKFNDYGVYVYNIPTKKIKSFMIRSNAEWDCFISYPLLLENEQMIFAIYRKKEHDEIIFKKLLKRSEW